MQDVLHEDGVELDGEDLLADEEEMDETSAEFLDDLIKKLIEFTEVFCSEPAPKDPFKFYPYQVPIAYSVIESFIIGGAASGEKTLIATRQSGKSEIVANCIAAMMAVLPQLAFVYPHWLGKYKNGVLVGVFAPTEEQADTVFSRIVSKLTSDTAVDVLFEFDEKTGTKGARGKGKVIGLSKSGSLCRMQTCNPAAKVESKTYHFVFIDEAQEADERMIKKSIQPMLASTDGVMWLGGTAQSYKSYFYHAIQRNKRMDVNGGRGHKQRHWEYDWKIAAKYNDFYRRFIKQKITEIGEDADEFRMSYCNEWLLEKGMFVTEERLERLYDRSMKRVKQFWRTPIVVGIDVARSNDSTVVTPVWVDWDHPDPFGFYEHRVLDWLEINNVDWETQYFEILDYLKNYNVMRIGVDAQGVGGAVAERLQLLLPSIEVMAVGSDLKAQNERWTHLTQLIQRQQLFIPGHAEARRTKAWKKFNQQMTDLERLQKGSAMLAAAPDEKGAFDDYADSLALACHMSVQDTMPEMQVFNNPFFD